MGLTLERTAALLAGLPTSVPGSSIDRMCAVDAIADEADRILQEGVVAEAQDIDLALLLGGGWPFANGGITPLLDRTGTAERVTGRRCLPRGVASLPG